MAGFRFAASEAAASRANVAIRLILQDVGLLAPPHRILTVDPALAKYNSNPPRCICTFNFARAMKRNLNLEGLLCFGGSIEKFFIFFFTFSEGVMSFEEYDFIAQIWKIE